MRRTISASGFTLVELSIVLVIIGLIAGGVLVGRDLIKVAEIRSQISQINSYTTAVNTFNAKYDGLPGDLAVNLATQFGFATTSCDGSSGMRDGNGFVESATNPVSSTLFNCCYDVMGSYEQSLLFADLSQANLIDGSFTATNSCGPAPTSGNVKDYMPKGKLGSNYVYASEFKFVLIPGGGANIPIMANYFMLSPVKTISPLSNSPGLSVEQAYQIDTKMDDGLPETGKVVASGLLSNPTPCCTMTYGVINSGNTPSATSCFDASINGVFTAGNPLEYSLSVNDGSGMNCFLAFQFR